MGAARSRTFDVWALNPFDWRQEMQSSPMAAYAVRPRHGLVSAARRKAASASPLLATTLLTAAVFLLPAPGARQQAQASAGQIEVPNVPAALR
ncbi:MAG: hypothetical protein M9895_15390 [Aquamicrobium sp.]|uniref:hypothetical protein n=1 Tax=Aquamicrobium sp. TaxID=1872579 RepID=UPI00349E93BB|nr:hypothetical protein [Aquamicrobium sp.]MCO5156203.1 hypothetical protein [Aquamicrobium sp.]